ncbi:MAG: hypothetical protein DHS20C14_00790 [Phycisphaeraceae bacterium]|nr:MAG: hypothetical protein DHS20C14_00790 [Phycisphaeraceae bacterium]
MLTLATTVVLIGLALLALGIRGKRVSSAPHCAACRFELSGLPDPIWSHRCPECGTGLGVGDAVTSGLRARRTAWIIAGAALFFIGAALHPWAAALTGGSSYRWRPFSMLTIEAQLSPGTPTSPALAEIERRANTGTLTAAQWGRFAELALEIQADPGRPWNTLWGDLFTIADLKGHTTDEQFMSYAQAVLGGLSPRSNLVWIVDPEADVEHRDYPRPWYAVQRMPRDRRLAERPASDPVYIFELLDAAIDGHPVAIWDWSAFYEREYGRGSPEDSLSMFQLTAVETTSADAPPPPGARLCMFYAPYTRTPGVQAPLARIGVVLDGLEPGSYTLETTWRVHVARSTRMSVVVDAADVTVEAALTVHGDYAELYDVIDDPNLDAAVAEIWAETELEFVARDRRERLDAPVIAEFDARAPGTEYPHAFAVKMVLRGDDGREIELRSYYEGPPYRLAHVESAGHVWGSHRKPGYVHRDDLETLRGFGPEATLVLRFDPRVAASAVAWEAANGEPRPAFWAHDIEIGRVEIPEWATTPKP